MAYRVCKHSLEKFGNKTLPLIQAELRDTGMYYRPYDKNAATEFSITRFLTPILGRKQNEDYAIFVDCDFLFTKDVKEVISEIDITKAVSVVKHDYVPKTQIKMDGCRQHVYPRKNWSSFIVFNLQHPALDKLTVELVNRESPQYLHRFQWLNDEDIGELSTDWNFLVGEYEPDKIPAAIHYTLGGPWFEQTKNCDFADLWIQESHFVR